MKKTLLWVASLIAGCVFIFFSLLVCDIVMFQSIVDEWFSFVAFVCILLVLFAGISWMNQKFCTVPLLFACYIYLCKCCVSAGRDKCISETESKYDFVLPDGCCDVWRDLLCAEL